MKSWIQCGFCAWLLCVAACGEDAPAEPAQHEHEGGTQDGEEAAFAGCPDSIPKFSLGMQATAGDIQAKLVAASPAPPERYFNDWTVAFESADGEPRTDVTLCGARTFMPVHGHYGTPDPRVTQHADDRAVFELDALNLFMRGPWEVRLKVSAADGGEHDIVFEVCVEQE